MCRSGKLKWRRRIVAAASMLLGIFALAWPASADTILDVRSGDGGVLRGIRASQGGGHLVARGIDITQIAAGSSIIPVLMGQMSFTSGAIDGMKPGERLFGPGGSLAVTGCVGLTGSASTQCGAGDFRGTLITAEFLNAMLVEKKGKFFLEAEVLESISPELASLLGLSRTTYRAELELALVRVGRSRWEIEGGFLNVISEPASILLTGIALLSLVLIQGPFRLATFVLPRWTN